MLRIAGTRFLCVDFSRSFSNVLQKSPNRLLFTDSFLGLNSVHAVQEQDLAKLLRQSTRNIQVERSRILASAEKGLLLSRDLDILGCMAVDSADITLYQNTVLRFLELTQASKISQLNAGPHIYKLCQLHHLLNDHNHCTQFLKEENVKKVFQMDAKLAIQSYLLLYNLLFKNRKFSAIIKHNRDLDMSEFDNSFDSRSFLTILMLAFVKSGEPGSFSQATQIMNSHSGPGRVHGRLTHAYAWLACKDGDHAVAYEIVHPDSNNSLKINIQVFSLLELGKLEDAISVLEKFIQTNVGPDRPERRRPLLCREVVQKLAEAVKNSEDKELVFKLKKTFMELDTAAEITESGIEDLLLIPMDSVGTSQRNRISSMEDLKRNYKRTF